MMDGKTFVFVVMTDDISCSHRGDDGQIASVGAWIQEGAGDSEESVVRGAPSEELA